jgi:hypothetical protein
LSVRTWNSSALKRLRTKYSSDSREKICAPRARKLLSEQQTPPD